jgi:uncharacterized NAD-dependent epimerase/dehydratase family protein
VHTTEVVTPRVVQLWDRAPVRETSGVAGTLNTNHLDASGAADAVAEYETALGGPATDPVRHGAEAVLDAVSDERVAGDNPCRGGTVAGDPQR